MKIEPHDHAPKPLTKRLRDIHPGEFFRWEGRLYKYDSCMIVLCVDDLKRYDWHLTPNILDREVAILDTPHWDRWRELTKNHFPTKFVEPATVPVRDMKPGQPFVLPMVHDGEMNGRYICGDHGSMTRLSDGKVYTNMGDCRGIPINGKFVEEDQPQ